MQIEEERMVEEEKQEIAAVKAVKEEEEDEDDDGPPPGFQCIITPKPAQAADNDEAADNEEDDGPPPGFDCIAPKPLQSLHCSAEITPVASSDAVSIKQDDMDDDEDGPPPGWEFSKLVNALPLETSNTADMEEGNEELDEGPPPGWESVLPCQTPQPHTPPLQPSTVSPNIEMGSKEITPENDNEVSHLELEHAPMPGQSSPATPPSQQLPSSEQSAAMADYVHATYLDAGNKDEDKKIEEKRPSSGHQQPISPLEKLPSNPHPVPKLSSSGTFIDGEPIINLPPKTIELKKVEFSKEERDFYCRLEADSRAQFAEYAAAGTVKQNYINILLMLLRLRQACDHRLLVKGFNSNSKFASSTETAKKLPREKQCFLLDCLEGSLAICGICNDPPEDAVATVCGHVFCNQCISERISGDDTQCPTKKCKTHLIMSNVFSITTLRNALSDQLSIQITDPDVAEASEPQMLRSPLDSSKIRAALDLLSSLSKPHDCTRRTSPSEKIEGSNCSEKLHIDSTDDSSTSDTCRDSVQVVGQKAIVFSQWTGMLDLLESCLKTSSIQYRRLDGTMPIAARDKAVKDFNNLPEVSVMIMSLKAASLELNMVAACNVLLLDLWWNPTTEDQAIDRAHRIGQRRPVSVYRLTVKDTVEDRILALQQRKRKMVSYAFGEDETGSRQSRLTVEDLKYLFRAD